MKVTVIISTHDNRASMLDDALASLMAQTVKAHEIIVLNDTDDHWLTPVIAKYPDLLITEFYSDKELGFVEKLDYGVSISTGDAILVLCDDDMLEPTFIEKTSRRMDEGFDIVYTDMQTFGKRDELIRSREWNKGNFKVSTVPYISSLFRKSIYEKVGGWKQIAYSDWDFWYTCYLAGAAAAWIQEPLFLYRLHDTNASNNENENIYRQEFINTHFKD